MVIFWNDLALYTGSEASGDYYNDKDKKIVYLEKLIKLTEFMSGQEMKAKPQKIVAGLEPEVLKLLIAAHKCITSGSFQIGNKWKILRSLCCKGFGRRIRTITS